jgi:DNA-binding NtrC family response regulator
MNEKFEGFVEHLLSGNIFLEEAIELLERRMIQRTLERTEGNQSEASKQLGIHRNTLQKKLVAYGLGGRRIRAQRKTAARQGRQGEPKAGAA